MDLLSGHATRARGNRVGLNDKSVINMTDKNSQVQCPKCGTQISLTEALSAEVEERYKMEYQRKMSLAENDWKDRARQFEKKLREQVAGDRKIEWEDLKNRLGESAKKLEEAQKNELDLRKRARELEEKEKHMALEMQRQLDEERKKISDDVGRRLSDDFRMKALEKDKQLDEMRKQIEELKRKAEHSSEQRQGEVMELEFEASLKSQFPMDVIEPVAKGIRGADVIQRVVLPTGQTVGTIMWEMKRTRSWSDGWIEKLKEDQRALRSEFGVIVTQTMPRDTRGLTVIDGIWVTEFTSAIGLGHALRGQLIQLFHAQSAASGKGEKMEFLYNYLTGIAFRQRVEGIVDAFRSLQDDLEKEKRAYQKIWAAREQQLSRVMNNTVGLYGDIQGIVGASLPKIERLELPSGDLLDS